MQEKTKAIIVDLDGTLCDVEHRVHHVKLKIKNWIKFNELLIHDDINHWCFELIEAMSLKGYHILFVTGRGEAFRLATETWLIKHRVKYNHLHMRGEMDYREDSDVKEELYLQKIKDHYKILFVVDDRQSVVDRWRKLGLTCLQCAVGNF